MEKIPERGLFPLRKSGKLAKLLKEYNLPFSSPPTRTEYLHLIEVIEKEEEKLGEYRRKIKEGKVTYFPYYRKQSVKMDNLHFVFRAVTTALLPPWPTRKFKGWI